MKRSLIAPSVVLVIILGLSSLPVLANYFNVNQTINTKQLQQISINLSVNNLQQANILKITKVNNLASGYLKGEIKLGGRTIKTITGNSTEINLSPFLKKGNNILEILGSCSPSNSSIKVEFIGHNTAISQQNSGTGKINYQLIIDVR
jgi:hypothetical protein